MKRNPRNIPVDPDDQTQEAHESTDPIIQPTHPVLLAVAEHLQKHGFAYAVMAKGDGLHVSLSEKGFVWSTLVTVLEDKNMLRIAARLPLFVPPARRREAAVLLARLNHGNLIGSWQMDPDDGETFYVTVHLFGSRTPEEEHIHTLMLITAWAMGNEGPQILRLIQKPSGRRLKLPPPGSN